MIFTGFEINFIVLAETLAEAATADFWQSRRAQAFTPEVEAKFVGDVAVGDAEDVFSGFQSEWFELLLTIAEAGLINLVAIIGGFGCVGVIFCFGFDELATRLGQSNDRRLCGASTG